MKYQQYLLPHPVLGIHDDIDCVVDFEKLIKSKPSSDHYDIILNAEFKNNELESLLSENKIVFACEVNCSATLFRKTYESNSINLQFELSKSDLRGKVQFDCGLIAKEAIKEYSNSSAHKDYLGFRFDIEPGDVLGHFETFQFTADIDYRKLKAVSSFMEVIDGGDIEISDYDLDNPKILVKLPTPEYKLFCKDSISKQSDYSPIFHCSIVFNALLYALINIDEHRERQWAQVILHRMEEESELNYYSLDEKAHLMDITQTLLGNPVKRLINCLEYMSEKESDLQPK